jgi:2-polyprenyl-6-methoxyphenol hydroxylase-like FAD-dependent oxidoreductase
MHTETTPVLIAGGGLAGLSAAMFLAWRGTPVILVERHAGSSTHPRAIGYTIRTLEHFRAVGLGDAIPQSRGMTPRRVRAESLAGQWFEESPWSPPSPGQATMEFSPCTGAAMAQDRLEPILRDKAVELGADIRLGTELIGFDQDDDGVTARLRAADGGEYEIRAGYLVAADGSRSPIRAALGIGRSGNGLLAVQRSVLFRAPLQEYLEKGISQFDIDQPGLRAFLTTYQDGRWVLMLGDDDERDDDALKELVARAIGRTDLEIDLITTGRWELSALIADRFSAGRVFLAGDAAHTLPPNRGGYGANTGIDDAHNLAWKLSAVVSGQSGPALLETYDAERRPVAWLRHEQIFARADFKARIDGPKSDAPVIDDAAMELGQLYRSTAVIGAGPGLPRAQRPDEWAGQPGTRAPHLWVLAGDEELSTLDLFGRTWVLLSEDERWRAAASRAAASLGLDVAFINVGTDVKPADPAAFRAAYGVPPDGASLIRPDGYVAWRAPGLPADPAGTLTSALAQVSCATRGLP